MKPPRRTDTIRDRFPDSPRFFRGSHRHAARIAATRPGSGDGGQRVRRIGHCGGASRRRPSGPRSGPRVEPARQHRSARRGRGRRYSRSRLGRRQRSAASAISFTPRPTTGSGRPPPTISSAPMSKARASSWRRPCAPGLERIVYTSSVATFDLRAGGLADETRHAAPHRSHRRLQAQQGHRRGPRRRHDRARPACPP